MIATSHSHSHCFCCQETEGLKHLFTLNSAGFLTLLLLHGRKKGFHLPANLQKKIPFKAKPWHHYTVASAFKTV